MNQAIAYLNFYLGTIASIVIIGTVVLIGRAALYLGSYVKSVIDAEKR